MFVIGDYILDYNFFYPFAPMLYHYQNPQDVEYFDTTKQIRTCFRSFNK